MSGTERIAAAQSDRVHLMFGDCLERMAEIPAGSVDMVLCDLPYGTTACKWDAVIPFEPLWAHYERVIRDNGAIVLTASQPFTTALAASNLALFKYEWVWAKSNAGDVMNAKNKPMKKHENILVFSKGTTANKSPRRMPYHPQGLVPCEKERRGDDYSKLADKAFREPRPSHGNYVQQFTGYPTSILHFNNERGAVHPTQKPVALCEYLVKTYTLEGETVLDNTMGSGTTGVACANTGRKFIGIERDATYFGTCLDRVGGAYGLRPEQLMSAADGERLLFAELGL